jgi:hypothetical protein
VVRKVAAAAIVALAIASGAAADGDPASDVLLQQNAFFPVPAPGGDSQKGLNQAVASVYAKSYRIKVAMIASDTDLGAIPSLFNHPADYAKFLGTELQFIYVGPLLIVMPAGFGVYDGGRTTAGEDAVLARLEVGGTSADDLTRSATAAVNALLAAGALRSKDILPPFAQLVSATGRRGRTLKLGYRLYDDSGKASVVVKLSTNAGRLLATLKVPPRTTSFQVLATVAWKVPPSLPPGQVKACLVATDAGGNRSRKACEAILIT